MWEMNRVLIALTKVLGSLHSYTSQQVVPNVCQNGSMRDLLACFKFLLTERFVGAWTRWFVEKDERYQQQDCQLDPRSWPRGEVVGPPPAREATFPIGKSTA